MEKFKILGFDIGITSIGWAVLEGSINAADSSSASGVDSSAGQNVASSGANESQLELKDCGVRIFTKAEQPKTGKSLALPRREARGTRRRLARRAARLNALKRLICAEFGLDIKDYLAKDGELPSAYANKLSCKLFQVYLKFDFYKSPYQLRAEALERKLSADELARVILHIAKHRGYGNKHAKDDFTDELEKELDSNANSADNASETPTNEIKESKESKEADSGDEKAKEKKQVKNAIKENLKLLKASNCRTWGEYLYKKVYQKPRTAEQIAKINEEKAKKSGDKNAAQSAPNASMQFQNVRNKGGAYARCVTQKMLEDELKAIFKSQREFGFKFSENLSNHNQSPEAQTDNSPSLAEGVRGWVAKKCSFFAINSNESAITQTDNSPSLADSNTTTLDSRGWVAKEQAQDSNMDLPKRDIETKNLESKSFEAKILEIAFFQRPLKSFANKVGLCTFYCDDKNCPENEKKRAPKDSPSAIEFVALTTIINTLHNIVKDYKIDAFIYDKQTGEIYDKSRILKELEQKIPEILKAIFERDSFTYSDLRKILGLEKAEGIRFGDKRLDYANTAAYNEWDITKKIFEKLKDKTIKLDKEITSKKDIESLRAAILETFNLNAKKIAEYILAINDKDISQEKLETLKENLKQSCPNLKDSQINKIDKIKIANAEDIPLIESNKIKLFKQFQKAFGGKYGEFDRGTLDKIATDINLIKNRDELKETLKSKYKALDDLMIEKLSRLDFSKYNNLSLKALGKILPLMREGKRYDEAVKIAQEAKQDPMPKGKSFVKGDFLPPLKDFEENLANPVVARALSEFRKVCNALLKRYGKVHRIHIEFTREVGKNFITRNKWINQQNENAQKKQVAYNLCLQYELPINYTNLLKMQLFIEQGEFCVYSGKRITREHLLDSTALQIDHIYPYSRSFDDSYLNKVLVFTKENQHKTNQTPFEAWGNTPKWEKIEAFVSGCKNLNKKKAQRILDKHFKDKESKGFKDRNLNDTSYIANLTKDYVSKCLKFADEEENDNKVRVQVRSGALTSMLRHYWGLDTILDIKDDESKNSSLQTQAINPYRNELESAQYNVDCHESANADSRNDEINSTQEKLEPSDKKDRSNHLHHAIDAIIIAYATQAMVQNFSKFKSEEEKCRLKFYKKFKEEFEKANTEQYSQSEFKEQLKEKLKIYKKYRQKKLNDYKRLKSPNEHIHKIVKHKVLGIRDEKTNELIKDDNGEILERGIFVSKPPRKRVRGALHKETFYSWEALCREYEFVKSKRIRTKEEAENMANISLQNGTIIDIGNKKFVKNEDMPRLDIFTKGGKFYAVPIYAIDFARGNLPSKYVVAKKEWKELGDDFTFCFSLYQNDLIKIQKSDMKEAEYAYYISFNISTASIAIAKHDNFFTNLTDNQKKIFSQATKEKVETQGIGIQNLKVFKKMKVSPLGKVSEAKFEPREDCKLKTSKKI